jgi:hypothetical protein
MRHLFLVTTLTLAVPAMAAPDMTVFGMELGKPVELAACADTAARAAKPGGHKYTPPSAAKREADAAALAAAQADWKKNGQTYLKEGKTHADANRAQGDAEKKLGLTPGGDAGEKPNAMVKMAEEYAKGEVAPGSEPCVSPDRPPSNDFFVALFNMESNAERMAAPINLEVQGGERIVQILLPERRCPEWVKCKLYGVMNAGILKAVLILARAGHIDDEEVSRKLRDKYGEQTGGRAAGSIVEREWSLPGIHVVSNYRAGFQYLQDGTTQTATPLLLVTIETEARRNERKAAGERREKSQPKL